MNRFLRAVEARALAMREEMLSQPAATLRTEKLPPGRPPTLSERLMLRRMEDAERESRFRAAERMLREGMDWDEIAAALNLDAETRASTQRSLRNRAKKREAQ